VGKWGRPREVGERGDDDASGELDEEGVDAQAWLESAPSAAVGVTDCFVNTLRRSEGVRPRAAALDLRRSEGGVTTWTGELYARGPAGRRSGDDGVVIHR
jgi:hypothetical protein